MPKLTETFASAGLELTTAAVCRDITAVAEACELQEFGLLGVSAMGVVAIEYVVDEVARVGVALRRAELQPAGNTPVIWIV